MVAKSVAAFSVGFATGMAVLAITLSVTGHLTSDRQEVAMASTTTRLDPVAIPTVPPPEPVPLPVPQRDGVSASHLAMPLANIDPRKLESTFHQSRSGHEHEALDIMAPRGTPVMAVAEGSIAKLFTSRQGGLTVYQFDVTGAWCYYYAHLDHYAQGLKEGVLLRQGEVLGYVGSTGDASPDAPHLHFAIFQLGPEKHWWQGTAIDPLPLLKER